MRKINKPTTVPTSLNSKDTNKYRDEIISKGKYPKKKTINEFEFSQTTYDKKYKEQDVKTALGTAYKYKCAFCEQRIQQSHVEHFRPKSIYYWLVYSWDNLLYCCPTCNQNKKDKFPIDENKTRADITTIDITHIHNLGNEYNRIEENQFVNPEKEDVYSYLVFEKNGNISSSNTRVQKTITELKIDDIWLNERREELYNDFKSKVEARINDKKAGDIKAISKLEGLIDDFITDSQDEKKEYLSFRKYIIKHWLWELVS